MLDMGMEFAIESMSGFHGFDSDVNEANTD